MKSFEDYEDFLSNNNLPKKKLLKPTEKILIVFIAVLLSVILFLSGFLVSRFSGKYVSDEEYEILKKIDADSYEQLLLLYEDYTREDVAKYMSHLKGTTPEELDKVLELLQVGDVSTVIKFDLLFKALKVAEEYFYEDIDYDYLDKVVSKAALNALDSYSTITPSWGLVSTASYGLGINVETTIYNEYYINYVFEGSGADGKLIRGDRLYAIDGIRVENASLTLLKECLNKPLGNTFSITVIRDGLETNVSVTTKTYRQNEAYYVSDLGEGNEDVGYIALTKFGQNALVDFKNAINQYEADDKKALILDLRGNGGGSLNVLQEIAGYLMFNPNNKLIPQVPFLEINFTKMGTNTISPTADSNNYYRLFYDETTDKTYPIYVLCNGGTASASEALIGGMLYYGTGVLVGNKTYGKGIAQSTLNTPIKDDDSSSYGANYYVTVTIGKYYVYDKEADGGKKCIHGIGFTPSDDNIITDYAFSTDLASDSYVSRALELYRNR